MLRSNTCRNGSTRNARPTNVIRPPVPTIAPAPIAGIAISTPSTTATAINRASHGRLRPSSLSNLTARAIARRVVAYEPPTIAAYPTMTPRTRPRPGTGLAGMPTTLDL